MKKMKVLIVDDSVIYRAQIKAALLSLDWIEVVGSASNGKIAIERMEQGAVDLVILDLEMPELNGIETLKRINSKKINCKVLVFSSTSKRGAEIALEALRLGAHDFIAKPGGSDDRNALELVTSHQPHEVILKLLEPKLKSAFPDFVPERLASRVPESVEYPKIIWEIFRPEIIVIASSTGGPSLLEKVFSQLSGPLRCPILIAQHMPPVFTAALAERIERISGIRAQEGIHGEVVDHSKIYFAPGGYHMSLIGTKEKACISLDQGPLVNSVRPSADPLFQSASQIYKEKCLGFVLTGMGADGEAGARAIKRENGAVLIQSRESCVVFGMPGAVKASGAFDLTVEPSEIVNVLCEKGGASLKPQTMYSQVGGQ